MRKMWLRALACCLMAVLAITLLPSALLASDDESPQILDYRPSSNPVADRTVHLNVNKLDSSSHDYVEGAKLQIIDKETKEVMIEWESGSKTTSIDRELDVDRTYILREVSAPEGYEKADDVEFVLRSVNFETKGEVISGAEKKDGETNAEFNNISGDIETQAFVISLYDTQEVVERTETRTETRPNTTTNSNEQHTSRNETTNRTQPVSNNTEQEDEETVENEETPSVRRTSSAVVTEEQSEETPTETPQNTQDVRVLSSERVITEGDSYRYNTTNGGERRGGGTLTQTGDNTSYVPIIVVIVLGLAAVAGAIVIRRKK